MMADRAVVAVVPVPDRGQHAVGVEIEGVGPAAQLGRQQRDPLPEAASLDVGLAVDDLANDVLLLRARTGRLEDAGIRRAAAQRIVAKDGCFSDARRADGDVQHRASAHPGLARRSRGLGGLGLLDGGFLLGDQIGLEFGAVPFQHFGVALEEIVDRSLADRKIGLRSRSDDRSGTQLRGGLHSWRLSGRFAHLPHSLATELYEY